MMNRREALKRAALFTGGILSSSAIAGVLQGCKAEPQINWQPKFFTQEQAATLSDIAERIIPKTSTPGAKEAGVPEFIDLMLNDVYTDKEKKRFAAGVDEVEQASQQDYGDAFVDLEPAQQDELLKKFAAKAEQEAGQMEGEDSKTPFFPMVKELTMLGFFTSEVGCNDFLQYVAVPGRYDGCMPVSEAGGRAYAT